MRNTYNFRFLLSPSNPRTDNWVGQAFGLSYLNSQPGNSYLFRFKPYWAADSRLNDGPLFADRGKKTGGEVRTTVGGKRTNTKDAFTKSPIEQVVRRRLEALFSRGFTADITDAQALVVEYLNSELWSQDAVVDMVTLAHRVEEKQNLLKLGGSHGYRIQIRENALTMAEMMIGHIRRINNPEALVGSHTLAERDQEIHTSMITMSVPRAVIEKDAILPEMKFSSRPDPEAILFTGDKVGDRPQVIHDAIDSMMFFGTREDREAWLFASGTFGNTPDKEGNIGQYTNATEVNDREGIRNELLFGHKEDAQAIIRDQIWYADEPDIYGLIYQTLNADKFHSQHATVDWTVVHASSEIRKNAAIETDYVRVVLQAGGQAMIDSDIVKAYGAGTQQARYDLQQIERVEYNGFNALDVFGHVFFNGPDENPKNAKVIENITMTTYEGKTARAIRDNLVIIDSKVVQPGRNGWSDIVEAVPLPKASWTPEADVVKSDEKIRYTGWDPDAEIAYVERYHWGGREYDGQNHIRVELQPMDARGYDYIDSFVQIMPMDARITEEASVRVEKVHRVARIVDLLARVDILWKASTVIKHWDFIEKLDHNAKVIRYRWAEIGGVKEENLDKQAIILDVDLMKKGEKESLINPSVMIHLLADKSLLDGFLLKLMNFERPNAQALIQEYLNADRIPGNSAEAIVPVQPVADREHYDSDATVYGLTNAERDLEKLKGIINEMIIGHKAEEQRPAYIPVERYMLIGDMSEWEDVWHNYSPGVDVLDVPDSDYDYSQLANRVYDPETGVPLKPIGPTNKAAVKVKMPLHHPVPSNAEIGIGPTVVDNYVLMDTILAVESLKNRNKLRFAGMPVEKTMRELLAKLYAWIQQSAPGVFEYERSFRFVRWYAEATVTKLSTHILQRVYKSWVSSIHMNGDLGLDYTSTGWRYIAGANIIQTTSVDATMEFEQTNYIDGEITVRGYFDNPLGEGTMELKVDGTTIASLGSSDNGAFTLNAEVLAGHHNYEIVFNGASGRVSLSSLEITGCVFVSASTIADDSDTNGLKGCTTLMQMLLLYFDRHHGDGKKKGTMAIKQRGLWNQT